MSDKAQPASESARRAAAEVHALTFRRDGWAMVDLEGWAAIIDRYLAAERDAQASRAAEWEHKTAEAWERRDAAEARVRELEAALRSVLRETVAGSATWVESQRQARAALASKEAP